MKNIFRFTLFPAFFFWCYTATTGRYNVATGTNVVCETIELNNNRILISSEIETVSRKFLVDLSSVNSLILDATVVSEFYKKQNSKTEWTPNTDKSILKNIKLSLPTKNNLFAGNTLFNCDMENKESESFNCLTNSKPEFQGVYGFDFFNQKTTICHLDFDASTICNLTEKVILEKLTGENYKPIKANFNSHSVSIFITINRKEYEFLFDTGFNGTFNMPFHKNIPFLKENHQTFESLPGNSGKENSNKTVAYVYGNKSISLDGIYYSTQMIISNSFQKQRVGMGFIKGFNWIIDNRNRKVYFKKNTLSLDKGNIKNSYSVGVEANKLVIQTKNTEAVQFSLGAILSSVNDIAITGNTICEIQQLLNETDDWTTLRIETED